MDHPDSPTPDPQHGSAPRGRVVTQHFPPQEATALRELLCRHCGTLNRVRVSEALDHPARIRCGRCRQALFLSDDEAFTGLSAAAYQHELDRQTLSALQKLPGVSRALKWVLEELGERSWRLFNMASAVRTGPAQLGRYHALFTEACRRLDVSPVPELYVLQQPSPNAYTWGVEQPFVVATSGLLELLDDDELLSVFGHELGHIQADHVLYKTLAQLLGTAALVVAQSTLGIGRLVLYPLQLALLKWNRCSELTADRAALLASRSPDVVVRSSMKLAGGGRQLYEGMSVDEFIRQSRELATLEQDSLLNQAISLMQNVNRTHPFPVWRTHHLLEWAGRGDYLGVLAGSYTRRS